MRNRFNNQLSSVNESTSLLKSKLLFRPSKRRRSWISKQSFLSRKQSGFASFSTGGGEAGSCSRAGDRLGSSQPSGCQRMRDLEAGLRVSLFQRRGKRILLTSAGVIFREHARAILRQLENFLEELNREPGQLRGALHLGVVPVLNVALVPRLLGLFAADHPGISLTVEEISSTDI